MNSDLLNLLNINLEILDPQCNILKTFNFTSNEMRFKSFLEIIVFTKHLFFLQYNKYKLFGTTNYSNLNFHHFQLISCDDVSIKDVSKIVPDEPVRILIRAKGNPKKVKITSLYRSFKNNREKNRQNKQNKLKNKFKENYSFKKFKSEKQKKKKL